MSGISIVVPVHNGEKYVAENIESILEQTYSNIEIIYVCDGCTDDTVKILREYQADNRVRIIENKVKIGAAQSRNLGFEICTGEWVIFLDSDDVFEKDMIECMLQVGTDEKVDVVCCFNDDLKVNSKQTSIINNWKQKIMIESYPLIIPDERSYRYLFSITANCAWNKLIRRKVIENNGSVIKFQDLPNCNDIFFSMLVVMNANKIAYVERNLVHYRNEDNDNLTSERTLRKNYVLEALDGLYEYICTRQDCDKWLMGFYNKVFEELRGQRGCISQEVRDTIIRDFNYRYWRKWKIGQIDAGKLNSVAACEICRQKNIEEGPIDIFQIWDKKEAEFIQCLKQEGKAIAIWGAGKACEKLLFILASRRVFVDYIVDKNDMLWGREVCGYVVSNYAEIKENVDTVLVLNPIFFEEIKKEVGEGKQIINFTQEINYKNNV